MPIDQAYEFQPILDVLHCLEVSHQDQSLILEVIESHIEIWNQMGLKHRSLILHSTLQFLKYSAGMQSQPSVKSYFEHCLLTV